jgi:hypothetical protein
MPSRVRPARTHHRQSAGRRRERRRPRGRSRAHGRCVSHAGFKARRLRRPAPWKDVGARARGGDGSRREGHGRRGVVRDCERRVGDCAKDSRRRADASASTNGVGRIWVNLTTRQQTLLRVLSAEPDVQVTSGDALRRYRSEPRARRRAPSTPLVQVEHRMRVAPGRYAFDDPFLRRCVQVYGLPDIGIPTPPLLLPTR